MTEKNQFQEAIKALEERRRAIDIAITELKSISSKLGTPSSTVDITGSKSSGDAGDNAIGQLEIRSDAFFNMSIPDGAAKFLLMVKRPKDTRTIADALKKGGNLSTSKNFEATVHSALARNKAFIRVKKEWGLAEWYPALKTKAPETEEKPKSNRKGGRPKKVKEDQPSA